MSSIQKWEIGNGLDMMDKLPKKSVSLIILDLPYFDVIDNDWDHQWKNSDEYINWCKEWFTKCESVLKENGTLYYFNSRFKMMAAIDNTIESTTKLKFRQFITIYKGLQSIAGRVSDSLRTYPKATEYLSFYTFKDFTGTDMLSGKLSSRNPMVKYLVEEINRSGVSQGELRGLFLSKTGNETGCVTNWLKGYNFPLKWQYETIREYLNNKYGKNYLKREYDDLKREYDDLKREYDDTRYTFNSISGFADVWEFDFYKEKRYNHPTQKPFKLIERIVLTSSKEEDLVIDPCMGTGTTLMVCKAHNRNFEGREINENYRSTIISRAMPNTPSIEYFTKEKLLV